MKDDYPRNLLEFERWFSSEEACRSYLVQLRWPEGIVCSRCGGAEVWSASRGRWICRSCRYQGSATAGTIFQDTHVPLRLWFRAIWFVTSQKTGTNALGLQRMLGLGSYVTAWMLLHKLRRAMVRSGRERRRGRVEVDEVYFGGTEPGRIADPAKSRVAVAVEEQGRGMGRVRMARIADVKKQTLHRFVTWAVAPGTRVHTDAWGGYYGLSDLGYIHRPTCLNALTRSAAAAAMPRVHLVASLLKRWLIGTHQGAIAPRHLDYYLDEFTFRFNRRTSRSRGKLFYRLIQQAVQVDARPYATLVGGNPAPKI